MLYFFQINVSIALCQDGNLKAKRGTSLPVEVKSDGDALAIIQAAVRKHSAFNKAYIQEDNEHVLLFPDYEMVIDLPGTEELFVLHKYRDLIGKTYSRITFHLCERELFDCK